MDALALLAVMFGALLCLGVFGTVLGFFIWLLIKMMQDLKD